MHWNVDLCDKTVVWFIVVYISHVYSIDERQISSSVSYIAYVGYLTQ